MIVYADHANHMPSPTLVVHDRHVIVESMELEEMPVAERRMFQHDHATRFPPLRLSAQTTDGLAYRTDDEREAHACTLLSKARQYARNQERPSHPTQLPPYFSGGQSQFIEYFVGNNTGVNGIYPATVYTSKPPHEVSSSTSSRLTPEENSPANGARPSLATCVTIILMASGVAMPLRVKAESARCLTSSGTLI
ncbi:hypothetical protein [Bifidobacterium ruminantium]|uniref:hypothetical protein n=1 Tax=Bifidobacterium ruminantium TaxID=78346 RepID=UPI00248F6965|nr:hypothetical protein [Bifidobacterium ruminantium]